MEPVNRELARPRGKNETRRGVESVLTKSKTGRTLGGGDEACG